jgi:hypothetical protein
MTAQGADFADQDVMSGDLHAISEEWNNPPSIPSDTSGIPTIASSAIYTTVPDTPSSWAYPPTLPNVFPFSRDIDSLGAMLDNPWTPWNPSMAHFSFPWFMEELQMPLEFPGLTDLVHHPESVVHNATSAAPSQQTIPTMAVTRPQTATGSTSAPSYLNPEHICSTYTYPCRPFPEQQAISLQMAGAEVFGLIHNIPRQAVEGLNNFYETQRRDSTPILIPQDILHAFVELYFEYFDSQFPFLHPSRLEDPDLPWILLLATAAVGSHYSEIQGADEYNLALCDLLGRVVELTASKTTHFMTW